MGMGATGSWELRVWENESPLAGDPGQPSDPKRCVCGGQDWKPLGAACRDTSALAHISMRKHRLMLQEFVILRKKNPEIQFLNRKSDFKNMLEIIFF